MRRRGQGEGGQVAAEIAGQLEIRQRDWRQGNDRLHGGLRLAGGRGRGHWRRRHVARRRRRLGSGGRRRGFGSGAVSTAGDQQSAQRNEGGFHIFN